MNFKNNVFDRELPRSEYISEHPSDLAVADGEPGDFADPIIEDKKEELAKREADTISEEEDFKKAAADLEQLEELKEAVRKEMMDDLYTDSPEDKLRDLGPQRHDPEAWEKYNSRKKGKKPGRL